METNHGELPHEVAEFIDWLEGIRVTDVEAIEANRERDQLLNSLADQGVAVGCSGKKIYTGELSPGCVSCTRGSWSCLFLNDVCTASCFYCPSSHRADPPPTADRNTFPDLPAYLGYLDLNHIEGASFSGGDPLLALDMVLTWMAGDPRAVRFACVPLALLQR